MIKQRKIELLAPAKNLECGIEAINHGADAVYIGGQNFSLRANAKNFSLEDKENCESESAKAVFPRGRKGGLYPLRDRTCTILFPHR